MNFRQVIQRFLALFRKNRLDQELADELAAHLELAEHDARARGYSPEEAKLIARRNLGRVEHMKEVHRDQRSMRWVENAIADLRFGLRAIRKNPRFSCLVIGVLALGIGANSAMFSLVDAVLVKPLPFTEPDRMIRVWETYSPTSRNPTNTLDFLDWKRLNGSFEALSVESPLAATLTGSGEPERISGTLVSADFFQVFGVGAFRGRVFTEDEDQTGAEPVLVLSHRFWQTRFGGASDIVNRELVLDGISHQVVGVLPAGTFDRGGSQFWKPLIFSDEERTRGYHWLTVVGRLRPGVSLNQAQEELSAIDQELSELSPSWKRDWGVRVEPYDQGIVRSELRTSIKLGFGAVAMVLLIACANVTNLLLAKGAARSKEMSVRRALGAGRARLLVQLFTESLVLCVLGGVAGLLLAVALLRGLKALWADALPATANVGIDFRVFLFAGAVALGVALLVGLLPALQASFGKQARSLALSTRGATTKQASLLRFIVSGEVALSVILLCGSLLLMQSLLNLQRIESGVSTENILTLSIDLPESAYGTEESAVHFQEAALERVEAVPGVEQASFATDLPFEGVNEGQAMRIDGFEGGLGVNYKQIDPGYLSTLGIPVLAGRGISDQDRAGVEQVLLINQELATLLEDQAGITEPVGRAVSVSTAAYRGKDGGMEDYRIIGVLKSERVAPPGMDNDAVVYVPLAQVPTRDLNLLVKLKTDRSAGLVTSLRRAIASVDPNLAFGSIRTLEEVKGASFSDTSQPAKVIGIFALLAAGLAALGLYGVLAHTVEQQRRDISIRMAMGAEPRAIVSRTLRSGLSMVIAGLIMGTLASLGLTRLMINMLYGVSPMDPLSLVSAGGMILVVGLVAGSIPAYRAAQTNLVRVLRDEG